MMHEPLKGVKVVELVEWGAGPMCGRVLGDWGADVIKVETLAGDPNRTSGAANFGLKAGDPHENPNYDKNNLGTRSLPLDLKSEEGITAMYDLLEQSDVFLSSLRTKALKKLGLDYATLSAKFPRLICAYLTGYGDEGPMKDAPGFDLITYFARTGLLIDYCEKDTAPLSQAYGFGDMNTGATLAGGIAAALYQRTITGKGENVMISLLGQSIFNQSSPLMSVNMGTVRYPMTRTKPNQPLTNTFKCKDGEWVMVSILDYPRYYGIICEMIGRKDLIDDERFNTMAAGKANAEELTKILDGWFATVDSEEVSKILSSLDIPHDKIRHLTDLPNDPQALANNYVYWAPTRNGTPMILAATPIKFGNMDLPRHRGAALLGEHTVEILKEIGYDDARIKAMLDKKVTKVFEE